MDYNYIAELDPFEGMADGPLYEPNVQRAQDEEFDDYIEEFYQNSEPIGVLRWRIVFYYLRDVLQGVINFFAN